MAPRYLLLMLCAVAGCDRVFGLLEVPPDAVNGVADARLDAGDDGESDASAEDCFTDEFMAASIDSSHWPEVVVMAGAQVGHDAGALSFKLVTTTAIAYATLSSEVRDFTNDAVEVEVAQLPDVAATAELGMSVQIDSANRYLYLFSAGSIMTRTTVAGNDGGSSRGVTANDRYIRIRFASGLVNWEHSADRVAWTTERSGPTVVPIGAMRVVLFAGTYQAETSPGEPALDNFAMVCSP